MLCPACGWSHNRVAHSREIRRGRRRVRHCNGCDHRWKTIEEVVIRPAAQLEQECEHAEQ